MSGIFEEDTYNPEEDGITHINMYSKGKTDLGKLLSNFSLTPFVFLPYGNFLSVEGFYFYFLTGCKHEFFKELYGIEAKKMGKLYNHERIPDSLENRKIICGAIQRKILQNKELMDMLKESSLPIVHYYWSFDGSVYSIKTVPQFNWMCKEIERIRQYLKGKFT